MSMGNCQEDYQCPTCGCDYRRIDATRWYCAFCDDTMIELDDGPRRVDFEEARRYSAEAGER